LNKQSDEWHIEKVLAGETLAFSILVEKYQHMVFTISCKILENKEEAEDAAQETFIKAYKSLSKFNNKSSFSTWLYKIAYNQAIDKLKIKKKRGNLIEIDDVKEAIENIDIELDSHIDNKEIQLIIKQGIERLPSTDQLILTLYYYDGLRLKEIAEVMGLEENNIKIKLFRIRNKLSDFLKKHLMAYNEK
jgi:RNA polymerase sigma-70 factor (ECF subfamily)